MHKIKSPNLCVVEDVKIAINLAIEKFAENQNQTGLFARKFILMFEILNNLDNI